MGSRLITPSRKRMSSTARMTITTERMEGEGGMSGVLSGREREAGGEVVGVGGRVGVERVGLIEGFGVDDGGALVHAGPIRPVKIGTVQAFTRNFAATKFFA